MSVQEIMSLRQTVLPKASVTDMARSCVRIFQTPGKAGRIDRNDSTPWGVKSNENSRLTSPSPGSNPNSVSPARFGNQEVISLNHPSIIKGGRKAEPLDAPIYGYLSVNGHSTSYFSGDICLEAVPGEVANVNANERVNLTSNSVLSKTPILWIWGSRLPTQQINSTPSSPPLTELKG